MGRMTRRIPPWARVGPRSQRPQALARHASPDRAGGGAGSAPAPRTPQVPRRRPVQASPVQASPVQASPVQASPVQVSPAQPGTAAN
jgi:translation initiation factor IF-2